MPQSSIDATINLNVKGIASVSKASQKMKDFNRQLEKSVVIEKSVHEAVQRDVDTTKNSFKVRAERNEALRRTVDLKKGDLETTTNRNRLLVRNIQTEAQLKQATIETNKSISEREAILGRQAAIASRMGVSMEGGIPYKMREKIAFQARLQYGKDRAMMNRINLQLEDKQADAITRQVMQESQMEEHAKRYAEYEEKVLPTLKAKEASLDEQVLNYKQIEKELEKSLRLERQREMTDFRLEKTQQLQNVKWAENETTREHIRLMKTESKRRKANNKQIEWGWEQRKRDLQAEEKLLDKVRVQERRIARIRMQRYDPRSTMPLAGATHERRMTEGKERIEMLRAEGDEMMRVNKVNQANRRSVMQLSISYFVLLITLRQTITSMQQFFEEGTAMHSLVTDLGETIMQAVPFVQIMTSVMMLLQIEAAKLNMQLFAVSTTLLAAVAIYKVISSEGWKLKLLWGAMAVALIGLSGWLWATAQSATGAAAAITALRSTAGDPTVYKDVLKGAMLSALIGAVLTGIIVGVRAWKAPKGSFYPGAQTFPGGFRTVESSGIARLHAGEVVARPAEVSRQGVGNNITINVEAGARVDRQLLEKLGNVVQRSVA